MVGFAGDAVRRAVVAGGHGDGDAEGGGGLAGGIERGHGLRRPSGLRAAPADGDDAGLVGGVVDGGGDGVGKALVGVGRKVDDDLCAGRDGGGDLDVEHDLTIGAVRVGGRILALVYEDCGDGGRLLAEGLEVGSDVGGAVPSTQFDDADGLPGGGGCSGGKLVELPDLDGSVRGAGGCGAGADAAGGAGLVAVTKVRLGLRAVVQTKNGDNDLGEAGRDMDSALADAVGGAIDGGVLECDAEGLLHGGGGAGEQHGAALGLGRALFHGEAELVGEGMDLLQVSLVGCILSGVLGAGDAVFAEAFGINLILAADDDGDGELAGRGLFGRDLERCLLAALEQVAGFGGEMGRLLRSHLKCLAF